MKLIAVVAVLAACGKGTEGKAEHAPDQPVPVAKPSVTPIVDAAVPIDGPADRLHLPRTRIDARQVIWRTPSEVAQVLGAGVEREDHRWRHELAGGSFVLITYDGGRAVAIELPESRAGGPYSDAEWVAIDEYFNTKGRFVILGHHVEVGESFSGGMLAVYEQRYIKRLQKEADEAAKAITESDADEARDRAANLLRGRVHLQRLSAEMARSGVDASFEVGDTETDVWYRGLCDQPILDDLADRMKQSFSSFGFTRLRCLSYSASLK